MLSNIFLHYVLDECFVGDVQPRMKGRFFLLRFADDFIIGCELEEDARRIMEVLPKRFDRFGLAIHPEKTTLVKFKKPGSRGDSGKGSGTFDFLGFTHYWAKSRRGHWLIKRKTARRRLLQFTKHLWRWCRRYRHLPFGEQHRILCQKRRGHYQYYGVRGNFHVLAIVLRHTERTWRYWLSRRSNKGSITWEKFDAIRKTWPLPKAKIIHNI